MSVVITRISMLAVAVGGLLVSLPVSPPTALASPIDAYFAEQNGAAAGAVQPLPGSVRPSISMEEQVKPCYAAGEKVARALVSIKGLENIEGNIRIQVYSDDPDEFLENGKKLLRVDVPVSSLDMRVCIAFPVAGTYAMVVMHDRNANGRADVLTEGFGFSRNPKLMFSRPDHEEVAFAVAEGVTKMDVSLNYMFRIENKERRRRKRR